MRSPFQMEEREKMQALGYEGYARLLVVREKKEERLRKKAERQKK